MIVFISTCISYQSSIALGFYYFIILIQLGKIIIKRPRTIIWMARYIRNELLLFTKKVCKIVDLVVITCYRDYIIVSIVLNSF